MLLANSTLQAQTDVDSLVVNAVNRIVTSYPKATLQDIYKSFFQERFGPGHIIPNEESAITISQKRNSSMAGRMPHDLRTNRIKW